MSYQVLARKWRPQSFSEVLGQEHITRALSNAVLSKKIAHAYLLTGTRGVGKTTIARIFAKALCCENLSSSGDPCGKCQSCCSIQNGTSLDYFEADGASNNKVENIREIIESVNYLPTQGKYKVYVIDEVHMLTTSAFNALLKTLEEPPEHVIFVFATTDPQKLLGTVLSRCQRFDFKSLTTNQLMAHINTIASKEEIEFETPRCVEVIAEHGNGSVRDTLSLLDQVLSLSLERKISEEIVNDSLGLVNTHFIAGLLDSIIVGDQELFREVFQRINEQNIDFKAFVGQLQSELFRAIQDVQANKNTSLISDESLMTLGMHELIWIYETLVKDFKWCQESLIPMDSFQISLLKIIRRKDRFVSDEEKLHIEKKKVKKKDWDGALSYIKTASPTLYVNLEHGNLKDDIYYDEQRVDVHIAYPESGSVFFDIVNEATKRNELKKFLAEYFEVSEENVRLSVQIIRNSESEDIGFKSKVQIREEQHIEDEKNKKEALLSNKYLKDVETLFNGKVSKVVLSDKGHQ
jgi:DNA polymerase-3 subunit gamma/tau